MKVKSIGIFCVLFFTCTIINAQTSKETSSGRVGLTFSPLGESDIIYLQNIVGTPNYEGDSFFSIGANYIYPWNSWLETEVAVEYSDFTIQVTPHFNPNIDLSPYTTKIALIDIPLTLRANFLNYFFANGGMILDIDVNNSNAIDNQSGLGGVIGIGARYSFDFGMSVFINPTVKMHSYIPFAKDRHHQRLSEAAIRFGITYQLK